MLKHVVIFGISKTNELSSRQKAEELKERLLSLKDKISYLRNIEVGVNDIDASDDNSELVLICEFDNIDDCNKYQNNDEHLKVAREIGKYKTTRACVDYYY